MTTAMSLSSSLSLFILAFSLFALTSAQFQFFNGMFGHPQQQQQQQPSGSQQWAMHADSSTCRCPHSPSFSIDQLTLGCACNSSLLGIPLPRNLVCVHKPVDCPCPNGQDIKCVVPDTQDVGSGTRLCVRGGTDCAQVEKLVKKFAT
jgi:hypothetical protein